MKNTLTDTLLILLLVIGLGYIFSGIISRHEENECNIWAKQSNEFRDWYSVDWQREQCLQYNIILK